LNNGWKVIEDKTAGDTEILSFKKEDQIINVIATKDNKTTTIVSIEIAENQK
jgi:hypothetical protein